jgi:hypothetical protein
MSWVVGSWCEMNCTCPQSNCHDWALKQRTALDSDQRLLLEPCSWQGRGGGRDPLWQGRMSLLFMETMLLKLDALLLVVPRWTFGLFPKVRLICKEGGVLEQVFEVSMAKTLVPSCAACAISVSNV